ncbi:MAG: histidinol-phosphatase HisJ family protein [Erysipelotrichaceae bacterium]|nr:histidinol-phosphatase HisJ family protein [Erysipelotrichaceae bacterium]
MFADYHVLCNYSSDSFVTMEQQVLRAIELGLQEVCFTDHVDYGVKKDWSEGNIDWVEMNGKKYSATNVDYEPYFRDLAEVKRKYGDKIVIRQGLELGVQTITIPQFEDMWKKYGDKLDFTLLSMHQVNNEQLWNQKFQSTRTQKQYNEEYYEEILRVVQQYKKYSVLAHLDLIIRYDLKGAYPFEGVKDIIAEILKVVIRDGKGIELNTSSWHYGLKDTQPSKAILKLYKDLGGKIITVGSDGHSMQYVADHFKDAYDILKNEIGFEEIYTFDHMEPIAHKL